MTLTLSLYSVVLILNAILLLSLSVYLYSKKDYKGASAFSLMMLSVAWWSWAVFHESIGGAVEDRIFFSKIAYLGIVLGGAQWILFSLEYTNAKRSLITNVKKFIYIVPIIILLIVATNDMHHLYWTEIIQISTDQYAPMIYEKGPLHIINTLYQYTLLIYGVVILWRYSFRVPKGARKQIQLTVYAMLIPWAFNIVFIMSNSIFSYYDLTPIVFLFMGAIIFYNMFRNKFLGIIPTAIQNVYDQLDGGIIILDVNLNIVDSNPTAKGIFGSILKRGVSLESLADTKGYKRCIEGESTEFYDERSKKWYEVKRSPFKNNKDNRGYIVFFYDISEKKSNEKDILDAKVFLTTVLNFVPGAVIAMDNKGNITLWNNRAEIVTGVKASEVMGMGNKIYSKKVYGKVRPLLANLLLKNTPEKMGNYENIKITKDSYATYGTLNGKEYLFNAKILYDINGKQIGAIESAMDMTDQRKNQKELEERVETLAKLNNIMLKREARLKKISSELDKLKKSK